MRIEDVIRITDGLLQNFPSVEMCESIKIDPLKIKRGDLYLDIECSTQNQKKALDNGAFAIISEKVSEVFDNEIAWIEVDSLRLACVKLCRYEFSRKNSNILFLDDISHEIIQSITKNREFAKLSSNVFESLITIKKSGENIKYSCSDERLALSIDPECSKIDNKFEVLKSKPRTPFYSSFSCNEKSHQDIRIPDIFVEKLCQITTYLQEKKIDFNIHNLCLQKHFSPLFVDHKLNKKEFGQSEKVIIFEKNMDMINFEIQFLNNFTTEFITCIPKRYRNFFSNHKKIYMFNNQDELKELLNKNYRRILVLGEREIYEDLFTPKKRVIGTLF